MNDLKQDNVIDIETELDNGFREYLKDLKQLKQSYGLVKLEDLFVQGYISNDIDYIRDVNGNANREVGKGFQHYFFPKANKMIYPYETYKPGSFNKTIMLTITKLNKVKVGDMSYLEKMHGSTYSVVVKNVEELQVLMETRYNELTIIRTLANQSDLVWVQVGKKITTEPVINTEMDKLDIDTL